MQYVEKKYMAQLKLRNCATGTVQVCREGRGKVEKTFPSVVKSRFYKVQSNSVITNGSGPAIFVRYNRVSL
jgi:hypothetical protein